MVNNQPSRAYITFAQAEGAIPLPRQLDLKEVSEELRAQLWQLVYNLIEGTKTRGGSYESLLGTQWSRILYRWWVYGLHHFGDEYEDNVKFWTQMLGEIFKKGNYVELLGFLEFVIRQPETNLKFVEAIDAILARCHAAYRVVDQSIIPISPEHQGRVIRQAFAEVSQTPYVGAKQHLTEAGRLLSQGKWADSIRESIHSVEAVAISIAGKEKTTQDALQKIEIRGKINHNLKKAILSLYNFTSDERGIRHSTISGEVNVDEADALYMFGVCAAFVTYMIRKSFYEPEMAQAA